MHIKYCISPLSNYENITRYYINRCNNRGNNLITQAIPGTLKFIYCALNEETTELGMLMPEGPPTSVYAGQAPCKAPYNLLRNY